MTETPSPTIPAIEALIDAFENACRETELADTDLSEQTYDEACAQRETARANLSAAIAALAGQGVPEGFKLVPIKPTLEMQNAGWRDLGSQGHRIEDIEIAPVYRAMLDAAPAPPATGGGGK